MDADSTNTRGSPRRIKLTKAAIEALKPGPALAIWYDIECPGFGVSVQPGGKKSYIAQSAFVLNGRKVSRRMVIGPVSMFATPADARRKAQKHLQEMRDGIDPTIKRRIDEQTGRTLQEVLDDYLSKSSLKPKTRIGYRSCVTVHLGDWLPRPIRAITITQVADRFDKITANVASRERQNQNGHATANGVMNVLRALWNYQLELDPSLPACPVRLKKKRHKTVRRDSMIRFTDLGKFVRAVRNLSDSTQRDYLLLMLYTGLRRGEAGGLKWSEVDLDEKALRIPADRTKANRRLDLPLSDIVFDLLNERRKAGRDANGYVFSANSKTGHVVEPRFAVRHASKESGVLSTANRVPMPHDLRRTYINLVSEAGLTEYPMKALINHALDDARDVTQGYLHYDVDRLRGPAQAVADLIKSLIAAPATKTATAAAEEVPWLAELLEEAEEPMPA